MVLTVLSLTDLRFFFVFCSMMLQQSDSNSMELGHNTSLLLDEILKNYDKRLRPGFGGTNVLFCVFTDLISGRRGFTVAFSFIPKEKNPTEKIC